MNEILPFTFPATGQPIRTVVVGGEPLVCHTDVCKILEHSNPSVAIRLVDDDEKVLIDTTDSDIGALNRDTPGNAQTWFLTEPGFYTLAFASRAPGAKVLRRWVTHEVLPTIRQTGGYVAAGAASGVPTHLTVTVNGLAELAHNEHVVPAAARILAFKRWRKPRKGIQAFVQLSIDLNLPGVERGAHGGELSA